MRKVYAGLFSSVDGVVEAPNEWQPGFDASSTLDSVDQWWNSTLIKGSVADFVADLRSQQGGVIGVGGSPSLVRSLIEAGLLDELTLMISPVVAGGGRKRQLARRCPAAL